MEIGRLQMFSDNICFEMRLGFAEMRIQLKQQQKTCMCDSRTCILLTPDFQLSNTVHCRISYVSMKFRIYFFFVESSEQNSLKGKKQNNYAWVHSTTEYYVLPAS